MAFTAANLKRVSEKLGIPMLPDDHPYYSEGAQITFVSRENKVSTKPGLSSMRGIRQQSRRNISNFIRRV